MRLMKNGILLAITILSIHEGLCQNNSKNKEVARLYFDEVVNNQRLELLNNVFTDTFLVHSLLDSTEEKKTIATHRKFLQDLFKGLPDIHYTIGNIIEEGDKVVMRVTLTATHKDELWGYPATGNRIKYLSEIFFFRFMNGKVIESWVQLDLYNLLKQLKNDSNNNR